MIHFRGYTEKYTDGTRIFHQPYVERETDEGAAEVWRGRIYRHEKCAINALEKVVALILDEPLPGRRTARRYRPSQPRSRTYRIWAGMWSRCTNPLSTSWRYYGGRCITVCPRWAIYETFLHDMGHAPEGMSIDRIDPEGNYEPQNCRWADAKTQASNKRPKQQSPRAENTRAAD